MLKYFNEMFLKNRSLNDKLFVYIASITMLLSLGMIIEIIVLDYPLINLLTWFVCGGLAGLSIYTMYIDCYFDLVKTIYIGIVIFVGLPYGWTLSSTRSPFTLGFAFIILISVSYFFEGPKRILLSIAVMLVSLSMILLGVVQPEIFPYVGDNQFLVDTIVLTPMLFFAAMYLLISFANDLKLKNAELQIASYTDYLTGLYNRRYVYEYLDKNVKNASSHDTIIIGMIDVNQFKLINDVYGHLFGDMVLKHLAKHIKSICGDKCIVGRTGGDEFTVIIKDHEGFSMRSFVEKFEKSYLQFDPQEYKDIPIINISGGFIICSKNMPIDEMLLMADKNLYAAKGKPNNGIVITSKLKEVRPA